MNHTNSQKQFGFTLLEILIAIFIFAIISFLASAILSSVFSTREATDTRSHRLAEIQIATIIMRRDFQQLVNRSVRAPNGNTIPALVAKTNSIEFTRTGHANPFGALQQSNLQRVSYEVKNHELIRITWPRLDRVSSTKPVERVLLNNVESGGFKYLGKSSAFHQQWPPSSLLIQQNQGAPAATTKTKGQNTAKNTSTKPPPTPPEEQTILIPRAIAINLRLKNWGNYYLVVPIMSSNL